MDDDGKMISSGADRSSEVELFLQDFLESIKSETPQLYNLETEYTKTKKNKSWFVIVLMTAVILVVSVAVFAIAAVITRDNRNVSGGIETFEDLNLKSLLDMTSRIQASFDAALSEKVYLEQKYQSELDALALKFESDMHFLDASNIDGVSLVSRQQELKSLYAAEANAVKAEFEPLIAKQDVLLKELQEQLASFDSQRIQEAQTHQDAINSQRRIFDIERKQMQAQYEAVIADLHQKLDETQRQIFASQMENIDTLSEAYKQELGLLDPVIADERGKAVLEEVKSYGAADIPFGTPVPSGENTGVDPDVVAGLRDGYEKLDYISQFVLSVPWKNSLSAYTAAMRDIAYLTGFYAEQLVRDSAGYSARQDELHRAETAGYVSRISALEAEGAAERDAAARYEYFFRSLVEQTGDTGYIIDSRDPEELFVYIDPLYADKADGARAYVFRAADEYVGSAVLERKDGYCFARMLEHGEAWPVQNYDRILLDVVVK